MTMMSCFTAPNDKMKDILKRTVSEAKSAISKVQLYNNTHTCHMYNVHEYIHTKVIGFKSSDFSLKGCAPLGFDL